ncbi:MAG: hypothetical protein LUE08_06965, partial [Akkermansiaceae bacterium]|nr:hypothetical protein [Akkermansiaceae bacterium]
MKLHLPLKLRAALAACLSAVSPFVPTVASGSLAVGAAVFALAAAQQAQAVTYAGTSYTVTAGSSSTDLAYASYYVTEQDAAGTTFTEDEENYVSGWNSASGGGDSSSTTVLSIVATDGTANTLRFTSSSGSGFVYTFRPLCVAGLIVEADSSVSSIAASGSNLRSFYLGDSDTETESFSTIDADFTISTGSYSGTTFTIRGTNTITVADGKTLTLTCSTNAVSQTDSLTLDGAGTVAVTNGLDIDGAVSLDAGALTVGGALNTGADSSINVAADASLTVTGMATLEGTLTSSGTLALNGGASFSNSVTVTGGTISITGELALSEAIVC